MILKLTKMSLVMKHISFASETKPANYGEMKKAKPIVLNLPTRKALPGKWYYTNKGVVSGPIEAQTLRTWLEGNHMGASLEIRMGDEGEFSELQDHFPNMDDAFCVPSQLCVYLLSIGETMVELKGYGVKIERHVDDLCTLIEEDVVSSGEVWIGKYYVGMLRDIGASILRCREEEPY